MTRFSLPLIALALSVPACVEARRPIVSADAVLADADLPPETSLNLVYSQTALSRTVRSASWEVGFERGAGWVLTSLRAVSGETTSDELLYDGDGSDERWSGALAYDPAAEDGPIFPNWAHQPQDGPLNPFEEGPAMIHFQQSWSVVGADFVGTTDYVLHADGRIHIHYDTTLKGETIVGGWLVSYLALDLAVIDAVSLDIGEGFPVPRPNAIGPDTFDSFFVEDADSGPHPQFLCAFGASTTDVAPVAVGIAPIGHADDVLARVTESSEGGNRSHSVKLQFDWARHNAEPRSYRASFLLATAIHDGCGGRIAPVLDSGLRPPLLSIRSGGTLKTDAAEDEDHDGFVEGLGYYHIQQDTAGGSNRSDSLEFSFSSAVNSATVRLDAAGTFDDVAAIRVTRDNEPLVAGRDFIAQLSDGGGRLFIVLLKGGTRAGVPYRVSW